MFAATRWRRFLERAGRDRDVARELESYLEIEIDENVARGMPAEAARDAARRKLGSTMRVREEVYLMNTIAPLDSLWQDLRYAGRTLRRNKSFTVAAVLSLALGVGANTAIFQLLDAIRLRPLPVERPQELVEVRLPPGTSRQGSANGRRPMWTYALIEELRRHQQAFSGLAVYSSSRFNNASSGEVRLVDGLFVSGDFFSVLGVTPHIGRLFAASDDRRGCAPTAVVSYAYWQRALGGSAGALGRTVLLDGVSFTIVGVTRPSFFGVDVGRQYDVAVPVCADALLSPRSRLDRRDAWWLAALGRMRPGWTVERTSMYLQQLSRGLFEATLPETYQAEARKNYLAMRMIAQPAAGGVSGLRADFGNPLLLLLGITGLLLVVACANLANLMLSRATARQREIAARLALGASRARVVRQLLVESVVLAALGVVAGAWIGHLLSRALVSVLADSYVAVFVDLAWNARVFAFAAAIGILACVLFGLAPALGATAIAPGDVLKTGARTVAASGRRHLARALIVSQVAVSLVLLVGGALFTRTLYNLLTTNPGFQHKATLIVNLSQLPAVEPGEAAQIVRRDLVARLSALPEVAHVVQADVVPLAGTGMWNENVKVEGPGVSGRDWGISNFNRVGVGFLKATGVPLRYGRDFTEHDTLGSAEVAIVSDEFVRKFVPGGHALGAKVRVEAPPGEPAPLYEIVGVAGDTKYGEPRDGIEPIVYLASMQERDPGTAAQLLVQPRGPVERMAPAIVDAMRRISPRALVEFLVWDDAISRQLVRERLMAALSAAFGIVAAALAAVGLYGLIAYSVARRRSEIGLRLAIGATRGAVFRLVVGEAALLIVLGVIVGCPVAALGARWSASLLYGLEAWDGVTFSVAPVALLLVGMAAAALPARRAARIDPSIALRDE